MSLVPITCHKCKHINSRNVRWIDPKDFIATKNAHLTLSFFCQKCQVGIAAKLKFQRDGQIEFINDIEFKTLIKTDSTFLMGDSTGEELDQPEILSENDALSMLQDIED